ncbi:MAG TPA: chloride channel protein [Steroidobacteraceae bacterium]|jgi:H+/Cl- antiporter ClcA
MSATLQQRTHGHDHLRDFSADPRILILSAMAVVVGTGGACAAWALLRLINIVTNFAWFGRYSTDTALIQNSGLGIATVLIPVAGCLIIGLMARFGSEKIRGHGIPEAIEAILIGRSRIQVRVALLKPLSSAISIGTGGPFGAEGPIIMTGGAIGSLFAQLFHLTNAERKTLLVAGAAAGMSATFGTPIAAMLLAVELLLFEWKPRSFVPVAVACVVAAGWRYWALGSAPLFSMLATGALPNSGLLLCILLGLICGLGSGLLTTLVYGTEDLFQRLPIHWMWWPAIGGVVVGVGGLIDPHALGVGYDSIQSLLNGGVTSSGAIRLLIVKAVIWAVALGSGTSGGVLAPLLIIGGVVGSLFGMEVSPTSTGMWPLVGMAAMMGGTMRAPLTAMMFGLELTHEINALVPLAIACATAHTTTVLLMKRSILTEKVARRGHHIVREYVVDPFEVTKVSQIMTTPVHTLRAGDTVGDTVAFFTAPDIPPRHKSYPVVDGDGRLVGVISRADALQWLLEEAPTDVPLSEQLSGQDVVVGYDDEQVGRLADRMAASGKGRIPIVSRSTGLLIGLVARRDVLAVRTHMMRHEREREAFI